MAVTSLSVPSLFVKYSSVKVLAWALFLNAISCVIFAVSYWKPMIYFSRFLMGVSQAVWVVYAPVWVNNFSPQGSQSLWLGMLAGFSPLGIMIGYVLTAFII